MMKMSLLSILFTISLLLTCTMVGDFKRDGVLTKGSINEIKHVVKGDSYSVRYSYQVEDKEYFAIRGYHEFGARTLQKKLLEKPVNVIYLGDNPSVSRTLITEYDFKSVGLVRPDSLKWVDQY